MVKLISCMCFGVFFFFFREEPRCDSDLRNLRMVTRFGGFLPPGLFVDNIIRVGRQELQAECDYRQEATFQERCVWSHRGLHFFASARLSITRTRFLQKKYM